MHVTKYFIAWLSFTGICNSIFAQNTTPAVQSTQQNAEWSVVADVSEGMQKLFFIDSTHGWVAGDSGKIYVTYDGGFRWIPQQTGTLSRIESILFLDNKVGVAAGFEQTLLRTNDGGETWSAIEVRGDSGLIYSSLTLAPEGRLYFLSNFGELHCSTDSGATWSNSYNFAQYGFSFLNYANSPTCYAMQLMLRSFYKSTDGGNEWQKIPIDIQYSGDIYFLNENVGWISEDWIFSSTWHDSVSLFITRNGGETWTRQSTLEGKSLRNIVFLDNFEGWLAGWGNTKIYHSPDSGKSWTQQFECDSLDWLCDIFFFDKESGWLVTQKGKVVKYAIPAGVSVQHDDNVIFPDCMLYQNFPNPFNRETTISYSLSQPAFIKLTIYDVLGREVETLVNEFQSSGYYTIDYNAENLCGGIYVYKINAGKGIKLTKRMLCLK